jgi:catechol 2,3-dioxygenase-like lactoylglutathione lyase family enzyme
MDANERRPERMTHVRQTDQMTALDVRDVRAFLPAKDLARSRAFYVALGWRDVWSNGTLVLVELAGHRLVLQDRYVREWADNAMVTVEVENALAWHEHASRVLAEGDFGEARVSEVRSEDWATVTYVWDPSGVLLHMAQFPA